jgi:hypothetical protein
MRPLIALLAPLLWLAAGPALAQEVATISVEVVQDAASDPGGDRFVAEGRAQSAAPDGIAAFGPFRVLDGKRAALVGATDASTPRDFARMLLAFPTLGTLEMVDCPGTSDDIANLRLGRMIRRAGIDTVVPAGGSVRSGAVELFLAGKHRRAAADAAFAVHSWQDADGLEPADFPADDPVNLAYLAYYREMGLSEAEARTFYEMTNAVPHAAARWLTADEFSGYVRLD